MTHDKAILFVDASQVNDAVLKHLEPQVEIKPYEDVFKFLKDTSAKMQNVSEEEVRWFSLCLRLILQFLLNINYVEVPRRENDKPRIS